MKHAYLITDTAHRMHTVNMYNWCSMMYQSPRRLMVGLKIKNLQHDSSFVQMSLTIVTILICPT